MRECGGRSPWNAAGTTRQQPAWPGLQQHHQLKADSLPGCFDLSTQFHPLSEQIHFGQVDLVIFWANAWIYNKHEFCSCHPHTFRSIFFNLDKYILKFGQIHFQIWTNIFGNLHKCRVGKVHPFMQLIEQFDVHIYIPSPQTQPSFAFLIHGIQFT